MQERERVSNIDIKAHLNNLRKNPKFTEEMLKLVEADLQYGLTIPETEMYTKKRFDYAQMRVCSACLRNGYPENVRECITKEGLSGEQMAVALEFYEKGVPVETVEEVMDSGQTAFIMKKLFRNIMQKLQEADRVTQAQEGYAQELLKQIKSVVEKIEYQEKRYDALNDKLKEIQTAGQDKKVQDNLLAQLKEKDGLLERQQNELNEARVAIARLRNEIDGMKKEREKLEKRTEELVQDAVKDTKSTETDKKKKSMQETVQSEIKREALVYPTFPGVMYGMRVLDEHGQLVSVVPAECMERKKGSHATNIFSRFVFKKKADIVRLVAEKNLEPKQLVQIRSAIEKGLSEEQILVLINNQLPAEQMEEIINIAIFENSQKQEG